MVPGKDRRNAAAKNVANGPGPSGSGLCGNGAGSGVDFVAGGNLGPFGNEANGDGSIPGMDMYEDDDEIQKLIEPRTDWADEDPDVDLLGGPQKGGPGTQSRDENPPAAAAAVSSTPTEKV